MCWQLLGFQFQLCSKKESRMTCAHSLHLGALGISGAVRVYAAGWADSVGMTMWRQPEAVTAMSERSRTTTTFSVSSSGCVSTALALGRGSISMIHLGKAALGLDRAGEVTDGHSMLQSRRNSTSKFGRSASLTTTRSWRSQIGPLTLVPPASFPMSWEIRIDFQPIGALVRSPPSLSTRLCVAVHSTTLASTAQREIAGVLVRRASRTNQQCAENLVPSHDQRHGPRLGIGTCARPLGH